ncbi:hypothetical protein [Candidatus Contendibacter odensensis]|uniref:DnaT DNA-binding domain-containing protein n=1 Tax=Candidatus Contendobacter odensis Run_B_J11 TaxID=1400861 RepID=A0A7U7GA76_9GAMM|nr:hypothetical protein [Candidatus Contendobacter odensis]MBK8752278.1 hypothetical protein [Candidatus Competibacteraceae bacterium]CDH44748.1 hypothetical protein BN874_1860012 [Candidatus Contendobacter odensis Run_B_J11]
MSRIRTVKPELFRHESLFDAELESGLPLRLAFIGLFTVADFKGCFLWKPRTLKLDVLPHDLIDFAQVLNALERHGFIQSYEVDGMKYGWIPSFTKHQRLQSKEIEAGSQIPDYRPAPTAEEQGTHPEQTQVHTRCVPEQTQVRTGTHPEAQEVEVEWKGRGREEEGRVPAQAPNAPTPTAMPSTPEVEPDTAPEATAKPAKAKATSKERPSASTGQRAAAKTSLPADFTITPEIQAWADQHHYGDLPAHLDSFRDKAKAKGYQYSDWTAAFRNAVRDDWAKLRTFPDTARTRTASNATAPQTPEAAEFETILRGLNAQNASRIIEGECYATH